MAAKKKKPGKKKSPAKKKAANKKKSSGSKKRSSKKKKKSSSRSSPPQIKTQSDFLRSISEIASEFTGSHKDAEAVTAGSSLLDSVVRYRVPTGCPCFDAMMDGGFPGSRITQMFGPESTGKSTKLQMAMIQCQMMGGVAILIDPELSFDPDRFRRMGGDPDAAIIIQKAYSGKVRGEKKSTSANPRKNRGLPAITVQDVFRYTYDILDSIMVKKKWEGRPIIVGLDSLDNITTDEVLNGDSGGMTHKPRLIRQGFREVTSPIAKSGAAFVIISQTIENIGGYGSAVQTSGGGGPKFISSVRLHTKRAWFDKNDFYTKTSDGTRTGQSLTRTIVIKNKLNRPYTEAITAINNDSSIAMEGVDEPFCLLYGLWDVLVTVKSGDSHRYLRATSLDRNGKPIPAIADFMEANGMNEGHEYAFFPSQWREWLATYPVIREYLLLWVKELYRRPDVYKPPTEGDDDGEQSDEEGDAAPVKP